MHSSQHSRPEQPAPREETGPARTPGGTTPPSPTHEATTPPGNPPIDESAVASGLERLDLVGNGH